MQPGHAASWCVGYPEVCPDRGCLQPLNPAAAATFNLIGGLIGELTGNGTAREGLFKDDFFHLGASP
jgi:hexosaminidase